MLNMQTWQWVVVAGVAVVSVGYMAFSIAMLYTRKAETRAVARKANAAESGIYGASAPENARVFDAFSYRVGARFAGRVRLVLDDGSLSVAGPRAPKSLYGLWIWLQGLGLALVPPLAAWAAVALDWRLALTALAVLVADIAVMAIGAGVWPGMGETEWLSGDGRFTALEVPVSAVSDVRIGAGWSRGGLRPVVILYVAGIDKLATGRAVSFYAPDDDGREVVYAFHMLSDEDASELARRLGADGP